MGNSEGDKPVKSEKPTSAPWEQSNVHVYPDWAAVQAYYGPGVIPSPYFNAAVASGHVAHPYMWAPQQMIPPYGSPYAAMYPHAGIYGPSASPIVTTPLTLETPTRSGNDSGPRKKPKESDVHAASGNGNSNSNSNSNYHTECPGDGGVRCQSQSVDCGTEGSCDRSDDSTAREDNDRSNNGVKDSGACRRQTIPYPSIDPNAGNGVVQGIPLASSKPLGSTSMPTPQMSHSSSAKADANAVTSVAPCAPILSGIGIQDVRELKREKRKQSNRESARRSRLRKQAEMEELRTKVDSWTVENMAIKSEINKLMEDSEKLRTENAALMEKLKYKEGQAGEMARNNIDEHEKAHINIENLLSRVNNSVAIGEHDGGGEEN